MNGNAAGIERGQIVEKGPSGGYRVESFTFDGETTPFLPALDGKAYDVGENVYYFMFDDGHGLILSAFV